MQTVRTIGFDIAKSVFQVHGVDTDGQAVIRRKLKRRCVLTFLKGGQRASWALRPAQHRIIGVGNCRRLGIGFV